MNIPTSLPRIRDTALMTACIVSAAMALLLNAPPGHAQEADESARNVEIVRGAFNAWAAGTGGPYDLLADDAAWTITGQSLAAGTYSDREAFMREVIRPFNARMRTGLKPAIRSLHADRGTVIVFFDASGVARDGKAYANTYAWLLDLRDGKIVRAFAFFDSIAFNDLWTRVQPVAETSP